MGHTNTPLACLVALLTLCLPLSSAFAAEPAGCWLPDSSEDRRLEIRDDGTFTFGPDSGRWATQADEIWLLGAEDGGTKWHFAVEGEKLVLDRPEDFKYLGSGEYFYFQMTDPKLEKTFSGADSAECAKAESVTATKAPTPDPRYQCDADEDCVASCSQGAVNKVWYQSRFGDGDSCKDGCTSKGTQPPKCVEHSCVAFHGGKPDEACTRRATIE